MFNDHEDDFDEPTDFEIWFDDNISYFRKGDGFPTPTVEIEHYYLSVYKPVMADLPPVVRKIMYRHYPEIEQEVRPVLTEEINSRLYRTGQSLLLNLYQLLDHLKNGDKLREVYRDFPAWEIYRKDIMVIHRSMFDSIEGLTLRQKHALYELMLKTFTDAYHPKDQRRYEFIEAIQPILLRYVPALETFGHDEWVIMYNFYAIEHTEFRLNFEYFQTFIHYGFEEKDFFRPYAEYHKMLTDKLKEEFEQSDNEQNENKDGDYRPDK